MYYLQSRYYNPEWGRFVNADGLVGEIGILLSHNMFTYCTNNPIVNYDPSGYSNSPIDGGGGAGLGEVVLALYVTLTTNPEIINEFEEAFMNAMILTEHLEQIRLAKSKVKSNDKNGEITEAGAPGSKEWNKAKKKIKEGKGKGINVKARNKEEAERLLNEAKPGLEKRLTYEPNPPKSGYEIHPVDNEYVMPHIKWRDWSGGRSNGADGHIFWDAK